MDYQTIALIVALVGMTAGFLWKLSRVEVAVRAEITKSRDEVESRQDQHLRETGETIAALRQKIHDVELYGSNNYMRRESFYQVKSEISAEVKSLGAQLNARLERMENKIDRNGHT